MCGRWLGVYIDKPRIRSNNVLIKYGSPVAPYQWRVIHPEASKVALWLRNLKNANTTKGGNKGRVKQGARGLPSNESENMKDWDVGSHSLLVWGLGVTADLRNGIRGGVYS